MISCSFQFQGIHSPVGTVTWWVLATACQCDSSWSSLSMGSGLSVMSSSWSSSSSPSRSSREISAMISDGGRSRSHYFLWEADRCEERNSWTWLGHSKDLLIKSHWTTGCSTDQMQIWLQFHDWCAVTSGSGAGLSFYRQQEAVLPVAPTAACWRLFFIFLINLLFSQINCISVFYAIRDLYTSSIFNRLLTSCSKNKQ